MKLIMFAIILTTVISSIKTHKIHKINVELLNEAVTKLVNMVSQIDEVIKENYNLKFTKVIKASLEFPFSLFN